MCYTTFQLTRTATLGTVERVAEKAVTTARLEVATMKVAIDDMLLTRISITLMKDYNILCYEILIADLTTK